MVRKFSQSGEMVECGLRRVFLGGLDCWAVSFPLLVLTALFM
jgi:hypothetical protein